MSIWIRKVEGKEQENYIELGTGEWDLRTLVKLFEKWLKNEGKELDDTVTWIADIGFSPREGANGGGPILSPEILSICVNKNMYLYLSEYDDRE